MVKADRSWPCPQNVAWQLPHLDCFSTLPEPRLLGHLNANTCIFPAYHVFPGFTVPAFPSLKTEQTDEVLELCLKETHSGGAIQNVYPSSLQKKLLIFDYSDNKTRLFYSPVFPLDQSPVVAAATEFTQVCDVNEGHEINMGQNYSIKYGLPEEYDENHTVNEESEMHEDTEEINALLYSDDDVDDYIDDDDDDEVTSTGCSPMPTERIYLMQEHSEDTKEEVASSDQPNKRQKLSDGGYERSSPRLDSLISVRLNETCEYVSDAESMCSTGQTPQEVNSVGQYSHKKG